jgi:hypothetical protein
MIRQLNRFVAGQLGLDLRRLLRALQSMPRYWSDERQFRRSFKGLLNHQPCLHDWYERGDASCDEYFLQDLVVAQQVLAANPTIHVDVGSRVDGFVAHVAAVRSIEVIDIRPMRSFHPNIVMHQADLLQLPTRWREYCDSVSCLHALEHVGLGRYGDPVCVDGHRAGLCSLATMLRPGGLLYLALPVGRERVVFNAHRVVDPVVLVALADELGLALMRLSWIVSAGGLSESVDMRRDLARLAGGDYALGVFVFRKATCCAL